MGMLDDEEPGPGQDPAVSATPSLKHGAEITDMVDSGMKIVGDPVLYGKLYGLFGGQHSMDIDGN